MFARLRPNLIPRLGPERILRFFLQRHLKTYIIGHHLATEQLRWHGTSLELCELDLDPQTLSEFLEGQDFQIKSGYIKNALIEPLLRQQKISLSLKGVDIEIEKATKSTKPKDPSPETKTTATPEPEQRESESNDYSDDDYFDENTEDHPGPVFESQGSLANFIENMMYNIGGTIEDFQIRFAKTYSHVLKKHISLVLQIPEIIIEDNNEPQEAPEENAKPNRILCNTVSLRKGFELILFVHDDDDIGNSALGYPRGESIVLADCPAMPEMNINQLMNQIRVVMDFSSKRFNLSMNLECCRAAMTPKIIETLHELFCLDFHSKSPPVDNLYGSEALLLSKIWDREPRVNEPQLVSDFQNEPGEDLMRSSMMFFDPQSDSDEDEEFHSFDEDHIETAPTNPLQESMMFGSPNDDPVMMSFVNNDDDDDDDDNDQEEDIHSKTQPEESTASTISFSLETKQLVLTLVYSDGFPLKDLNSIFRSKFDLKTETPPPYINRDHASLYISDFSTELFSDGELQTRKLNFNASQLGILEHLISLSSREQRFSSHHILKADRQISPTFPFCMIGKYEISPSETCVQLDLGEIDLAIDPELPTRFSHYLRSISSILSKTGVNVDSASKKTKRKSLNQPLNQDNPLESSFMESNQNDSLNNESSHDDSCEEELPEQSFTVTVLVKAIQLSLGPSRTLESTLSEILLFNLYELKISTVQYLSGPGAEWTVGFKKLTGALQSNPETDPYPILNCFMPHNDIGFDPIRVLFKTPSSSSTDSQNSPFPNQNDSSNRPNPPGGNETPSPKPTVGIPIMEDYMGDSGENHQGSYSPRGMSDSPTNAPYAREIESRFEGKENNPVITRNLSEFKHLAINSSDLVAFVVLPSVVISINQHYYQSLTRATQSLLSAFQSSLDALSQMNPNPSQNSNSDDKTNGDKDTEPKQSVAINCRLDSLDIQLEMDKEEFDSPVNYSLSLSKLDLFFVQEFDHTSTSYLGMYLSDLELVRGRSSYSHLIKKKRHLPSGVNQAEYVVSSVLEWTPLVSKFTLQVEQLDVFYWLGIDWPGDLSAFFSSSSEESKNENSPPSPNKPAHQQENPNPNPKGNENSNPDVQCYFTLADLALNYFPHSKPEETAAVFQFGGQGQTSFSFPLVDLNANFRFTQSQLSVFKRQESNTLGSARFSELNPMSLRPVGDLGYLEIEAAISFVDQGDKPQVKVELTNNSTDFHFCKDSYDVLMDLYEDYSLFNQPEDLGNHSSNPSEVEEDEDFVPVGPSSEDLVNLHYPREDTYNFSDMHALSDDFDQQLHLQAQNSPSKPPLSVERDPSPRTPTRQEERKKENPIDFTPQTSVPKPKESEVNAFEDVNVVTSSKHTNEEFDDEDSSNPFMQNSPVKTPQFQFQRAPPSGSMNPFLDQSSPDKLESKDEDSDFSDEDDFLVSFKSPPAKFEPQDKFSSKPTPAKFESKDDDDDDEYDFLDSCQPPVVQQFRQAPPPKVKVSEEIKRPMKPAPDPMGIDLDLWDDDPVPSDDDVQPMAQSQMHFDQNQNLRNSITINAEEEESFFSPNLQKSQGMSESFLDEVTPSMNPHETQSLIDEFEFMEDSEEPLPIVRIHQSLKKHLPQLMAGIEIRDDYTNIKDKVDILDLPKSFPRPLIQVVLTNFSAEIVLHSGKDWTCETKSGRDMDSTVTLKFTEMGVRFYSFGPDDPFLFYLGLNLKKFQILDGFLSSARYQFLCYDQSEAFNLGWSKSLDIVMWSKPASVAKPEQKRKFPSHSRISSLATLIVDLPPLQLNIDQHTFLFLLNFWKSSNPQPQELPPTIMWEQVKISDVSLLINYKAKTVEWKTLFTSTDVMENWVEFMNFCSIENFRVNVGRFVEQDIFSLGTIMEHFKEQYLVIIIEYFKSLGPIAPLRKISGGVWDLFYHPVTQYKKEGHIISGLNKGVRSLSHAVVVGGLEMGTKVASGAQMVLGYAVSPANESGTDERQKTSRHADQPSGFTEGLVQGYQVVCDETAEIQKALGNISTVASSDGYMYAVATAMPHIVFRPALAAAQATQRALLGARNYYEPSNKSQTDAIYKRVPKP